MGKKKRFSSIRSRRKSLLSKSKGTDSSVNASYMLWLPREICLYLLSFLTFKERRQIASVCRQWSSFSNLLTSSNRDVVVVLDCTHSMQRRFPNVIEFVKNRFFNEPTSSSSRFGFVAYNDHVPGKFDGREVVATKAFTSDCKEMVEYMNQMHFYGGSDTPEALLDGLQAAINFPWRDSSVAKQIILLCDAPAHGRSNTGDHSDHFPDGCPCGLKESEVLPRLEHKDIELHLVGIDTDLVPMRQNFQTLLPKMTFARLPD
jgi:hypothetical protein